MDEVSGYPPHGNPQGSGGSGTAVRIGEDRAARILERAAALDAKRNSEIELDQLREAAADAGISREAFDEAMAEQDNAVDARALQPKMNWRGQGAPTVSPNLFAHYTGLLRDVLGDDGQVMVVEDRIEWANDEGLLVSINPSTKATTAAVSAEGKLGGRLWAVSLSILPVFFLFFMIGVEEDDALLVAMGAGIAYLTGLLGVFFHHRRERKALRKKVERIRRQLQHLVTPGPADR